MWKAKGRSGTLIGYQLDPAMDVSMSIQRLQKLLSETRGDSVRIELQPNPSKGKKGGNMAHLLKMDVDLNTVNPSGSLPAVPVAGHPADFSKFEAMLNRLMEQNQQLQSELIKSQYENQIKALEQKIEGISNKESDDPIGKVIDMLVPVMAQYLPAMMKPAPSPDINGADPVSRLLAVDPEGMKVIEAIAKLAETDLATYNQYKPLLLSL
jgi:hypothetical protein